MKKLLYVLMMLPLIGLISAFLVFVLSSKEAMIGAAIGVGGIIAVILAVVGYVKLTE